LDKIATEASLTVTLDWGTVEDGKKQGTCVGALFTDSATKII